MTFRFPVTRLHFAFGLLIVARAVADGFIPEESPTTLHATHLMRNDSVIPKMGDDRLLGPLSASLAVRDIGQSREFYERQGFRRVMGDQSHNWLIMRNGETAVALFQVRVEQYIESPPEP
jgi:hypothetical protein